MSKRRLGVMFSLALGSLMGCGESGRIDLYTCEDPCGNGQPGTSCKHPCGDCRGQCVPSPAINFSGPTLLWIGAELDAPECPPRASNPVYEGHADLDDSNQCPPCECAGPACMLPSGVTASDATCAAGGGMLTSFDAPSSWNGSCTSPAAVSSDLLASMAIAPVTERPCAPVPPDVPNGAPYSPWKTFAKACAGEVADGRCDESGMTCVPTAEPPPPGFRQCINYVREGDPQCPAAYPEKFTFYERLEDTRACTPCECTQTAPSTCVAYLSTFQDAACSTPLISAPIGTGGSLCADVMPDVPLGSMEATWTTNEPGSCAASGGAPVGEAKPAHPSTFCCQPL